MEVLVVLDCFQVIPVPVRLIVTDCLADKLEAYIIFLLVFSVTCPKLPAR